MKREFNIVSYYHIESRICELLAIRGSWASDGNYDLVRWADERLSPLYKELKLLDEDSERRRLEALEEEYELWMQNLKNLQSNSWLSWLINWRPFLIMLRRYYMTPWKMKRKKG